MFVKKQVARPARREDNTKMDLWDSYGTRSGSCPVVGSVVPSGVRAATLVG